MKNREAIYHAALYMRLSKDDDGEGESASIITQRKMLRAYAQEHGYEVCGEYADDGWSGTNFERPGWRRLLADIESGKINMVIAKDLSRLGRDYIAAGQYTEIYFPSKGVRCIAVNDGYDSDHPSSDMAPFKNVINEMYARDISRKIRSAFKTKMLEGAFIGNFAPYGYRKDPEDKNHLLIDPVTAPVVREMFKKAENGLPPSEIAASFNARGIMTPSMYRYFKGQCAEPGGHIGCGQWTSSMICKMLRNVVYLGHIAQGKTTKVSFKSRLTLQNPPEDWIIAFNMHDPLVLQETYDNVRKRCVSRRYRQRTGFSNIFSGLAVCADCGRHMSTAGSGRKDKGYRLTCGGYKLYGRGACSNHFIDYETLCRVATREIQELLLLADSQKKEILGALSQYMEERGETAEKGGEKELEKREKELDRIIGRLYEDNACGKLDEDRFYRLLARYEKEQRQIANCLSLPAEKFQVEDCGNGGGYSDARSLLEDVTAVKELTQELLRKLIDRIEICQGCWDNGMGRGHRSQTIRIYYRFTR